MTIGRNIFELRKGCKLTQRELAVKLGVTEQSVSKWENDVCSPDISLFPQLARLFNVSIDRLFGFHLDSYETEVKKILDVDIASDDPYTGLKLEIEYYEKALEKYPNSDKIKLALAFAYSMLYRICNSEQEMKAGAEKAISICREIVAVSFDEEILDDSYYTLARVYSETGRYEAALDMLERISSDRYSRKILGKSQILGESRKYEELRLHTENTLYELYMTMDKLASFYYNALINKGEYDKALICCNLKEKISSLFDDCGRTLHTSARILNAFQKACVLKELGRREECLNALRGFVALAKTASIIPDSGHKVCELNELLGTVELTEEHFGASEAKKFACQMLGTKLYEYFDGDERYNNLLRELTE